MAVGLGGVAAGEGREYGEPLGVPYGGLLVGEEGELGGDEVEEVEVGVPHRQVEVEVGVSHKQVEVEVPHRQVEEVQSPRQVCPDKDPRLLLPRESLLEEESHCSHRCSL